MIAQPDGLRRAQSDDGSSAFPEVVGSGKMTWDGRDALRWRVLVAMRVSSLSRKLAPVLCSTQRPRFPVWSEEESGNQAVVRLRILSKERGGTARTVQLDVCMHAVLSG